MSDNMQQIPTRVLEKMIDIGQSLDGEHLCDVIFIMGSILNVAMRRIPKEEKSNFLDLIMNIISSENTTYDQPINKILQ